MRTSRGTSRRKQQSITSLPYDQIVSTCISCGSLWSPTYDICQNCDSAIPLFLRQVACSWCGEITKLEVGTTSCKNCMSPLFPNSTIDGSKQQLGKQAIMYRLREGRYCSACKEWSIASGVSIFANSGKHLLHVGKVKNIRLLQVVATGNNIQFPNSPQKIVRCMECCEANYIHWYRTTCIYCSSTLVSHDEIVQIFAQFKIVKNSNFKLCLTCNKKVPLAAPYCVNCDSGKFRQPYSQEIQAGETELSPLIECSLCGFLNTNEKVCWNCMRELAPPIKVAKEKSAEKRRLLRSSEQAVDPILEGDEYDEYDDEYIERPRKKTPAKKSAKSKAAKQSRGQEIRCPSCQQIELNTAKFCRNCGISLQKGKLTEQVKPQLPKGTEIQERSQDDEREVRLEWFN